MAARSCITVLLVFGVVLAAQASTESTDQSKADRKDFKPAFFGFEKFKKLFNKHYWSEISEVARRKLYMARNIRAFKTCIAYRNGLATSFERVNQLSDLRSDEIHHQLLVRADQVTANDATKADLQELQAELRRVANGDPSVGAELAEIEKREAQYKPPSAKLFTLFEDEDDLGNPNSYSDSKYDESEEEVEQEAEEFDEADFERLMLGSNDDDDDDDSGSPLVSAKERSFSSYLASKLKGAIKLKRNTSSSLPDEVFIDHRRTGCFFEPRNQGACGSCYIFASTSLMEYNLCRQLGHKVALSEQYTLDCGPLDRHRSCGGGDGSELMRFYMRYGAELRADYPYREIRQDCPYERSDRHKMGRYKIRKDTLKLTTRALYDYVLAKSPIMMSVNYWPGMQQYGGGIIKCPPESEVNWIKVVVSSSYADKLSFHEMVIVGSGREDGLEYWLIRNSWGVTWGEAGYMKLSKRHSNCIKLLDSWYLKSVEKEPIFYENPDYEPAKIISKIHENLLDQAIEMKAKYN